MSRFRDLPGGINRARYNWPQVSVIHPERGVFEMDVHCVRDPKSGETTLLAFPGHTRPNSIERKGQVDLIAEMARTMGNVIEPIDVSDVTDEMALLLAARLWANPGTQVIIMPREQEA
jgi:hypothetical protein